MKPRHLVAFLVVLAAVLAVNAQRAFATTATVAYAQTCDTATITIHSLWNGGTIHGVVTGPIPEITFTVPPLGTTPVTFKIIPSPLHVTVSSSDGRLQGTLTHTFTAERCGTTTTEAPPSTTTPTTAPTAPSTSTPASGVEPSPSQPVTTAPGVATSTPAPSPSRPPSPTPASLTLPATGSDDPVQRALIGLVAALVGTAVVVATRRRAS
jgi:LPXTG-motif cell wall-anchored protein